MVPNGTKHRVGQTNQKIKTSYRVFQKEVLIVFADSSASRASSNKVECIFQQPIPWAVEKYTET